LDTYQDLIAQIETLKKKAEDIRKSEQAAGIAEIKARMKELGLTVADLRETRGGASKKGSAPAKYRHPSTGEKWSGKGRTPNWLANEIKAGKSKEDFAA
jgi:DNA-binding protein H-NS